MLEWVLMRLRGLWRFLLTALAVATRPVRVADSIILNDKTNYYRALTFFATGIGLGLAVEALFSYIFKTHLDEFLYQIVLVVGWVANGFFIYLFLRLLRVKHTTVGNVYHCYSYSVGAGYFLYTLSAAFVVGYQFSENFAMVQASACEPRLVACVLREMGLLKDTQIVVGSLATLMGGYFAWVFAVLIGRNLGVPRWRPFVALLLGGTVGTFALSYILLLIMGKG